MLNTTQSWQKDMSFLIDEQRGESCSGGVVLRFYPLHSLKYFFLLRIYGKTFLSFFYHPIIMTYSLALVYFNFENILVSILVERQLTGPSV